MISPAKRARFFQRQNIGRLLDHAELIRRPRRIRADLADLLHGEETAASAWPHRLPRRGDGARDLVRLLPRACTIQSAIRSAERGPTPGICRSCAINSRIAAGYSTFLKTGGLFVRGESTRCSASGSSRRT